MAKPHAWEYNIAMHKYISQIIKQSTWCMIPCNTIQKLPNVKSPVLPGTWELKLKPLPDGSPLKFKAWYSVRGNKQTEGVDYFEAYAQVIRWSTVRLALTLILSNGRHTKQVEYTNEFSHEELKGKVFIEPSKGVFFKYGNDKVLKLIKSLYGLKQAPRTS